MNQGIPGTANFIVTPLDANLQQGAALVNAIGSYAGTVVLDADDGDESQSLQVQSDGNWAITLSPLLAARTLVATGATTGTGDDVLLYKGGPQVANLKFTGAGNFIIDVYPANADFPDNLANQIGAWAGQVPMPGGPTIVVIQANDGFSGGTAAWSVTFAG